MSQKQCEKCGEVVPEAKAFCPGCGGALVAEEDRKSASEFERSDNTVQFGQTMYNSLLTDMGLNISDASAATPAKRIEVVPAASTAPPKPRNQPAQHASVQAIPPQQEVARKSSLKWIVLGAVVLFLGALFLLAAGIALYLSGRA